MQDSNTVSKLSRQLVRVVASTKFRTILIASLIFAGFVLGSLTYIHPAYAQTREVEIELLARTFAFDPPRISVNLGDTVVFKIRSRDVVHGFYIDGYNVNVEVHPGEEEIVKIVADRVGKFRLRCSVICGPMHPYMVAELVVEPNNIFWGSAFAVALVSVSSVAYLGRGGRRTATDGGMPTYWKFDLFQIGPVKQLLKKRFFQFSVIVPNLAFFVIVIMTGLLGTPVGAKNFSIIFVWIIWWVALMIILVPFAARFWCTICPIPAPGEWLQRKSFVMKNPAKGFGLNLKWPKSLSNLWLANFGFLMIALWSALITTRPWITGALLLGLIVAALGISLVFQKRTFCRYVCPVAGFLGLYSMFSTLELRTKNLEICYKCTTKDCFKGNENGYGCPWFEMPQNVNRNAYCGLCTECVKTCPHDNRALSLRPIGGYDLVVDPVGKKRGLDEPWKAFIMLGCAVLYSVVMLGPWGWLKDWAGLTSWRTFIVYAMVFLGSTLALTPAIYGLAIAASKRLSGIKEIGFQKLFINYAYTLVPLGLMAWVAFSLSILLANGSYAFSLLSDPFGWGWDILGTRNYPWTPYRPDLLPFLQVPILLAGLFLSIDTGFKASQRLYPDRKSAVRSLLPIVAFLALVTLVLLRLYVG